MSGMNRRQVLQSLLATSFMPASVLPAPPQKSPVQFGPVRDRLLEAIHSGRATGVSVAVARRNQAIWSEGFGFADLEGGIVATPDTPFCLASITKTFTATLVATLASRGHLSLDAPAMRYLMTKPLRGPNGNPDDITVRMLGAHNSGLPGTFAAYLANGSVTAPSTDAFLRDYGRLAYPPGLVYEYGNIGFEALGAIVSDLTGQPFATVMKDKLLRPLGMRNSFFSHANDHMASAAIGYDSENNRIPDYTTATPPSGELYASANDLARFAQFHLGRPMQDSLQVLNRHWLRELHAPVFTGPRDIATTFGWFRSRLATGEPYLFKAGGQPGVAAKIFLLPSEDLAIVVLTNRTDSMSLVDECCRQIIRSFVPGFTIPEENAGPVPTTFTPSPEWLGSWKGKVKNAGADQNALLTMNASGKATLALSGRSPQAVMNMQQQDSGFEGTTSGLIDCDQSTAFGSRTLMLKLVPHEGKLCGRVTAMGTRPGLLVANLPYVLTFERA